MKFACIILAITTLSLHTNAALAASRAKPVRSLTSDQPQKGSANCRPRWPYVMITCYA